MFKGAFTAIITPFNRDQSVDYDRLEMLIERQIENGIDGIVPVGTTGESPSLNCEEHLRVIETTVQVCRKRVKVIAGTGANCTKEACELTAAARDCGADATLQVTPYYNKPNQEGLLRHFETVADLGLPVVLYNIPGRCGVEIALDTVVKLSAHPHIAAIKEAAGSVPRVSNILQRCDISVLSGDDPLTLPMLAVGAQGVISVASNSAPRLVAEMVHAALDGRWEEARRIHQRCWRFFNAIFIDTNPIPIKAALALQGLAEEVYRLPLTPLRREMRIELEECLRELDLLPSNKS
ncbi:MAG: 4-hydroxy-tetrahydrodipicolinate synthase [Kiritimatiellia bacterium]